MIIRSLAGLAAVIAMGGCATSMGASKPDIHTNPAHTNRLAKESSPYLLQHAHNPVDWYPWGSEAFAKAKQEDKPVFLSVGYAACHWCHVMERESFESGEIAKILNDGFVSIKVDREERPDIDDLYMTAVQMINRNGGWPMSVFLTPDGKPFYGATYFPPDAFKSLLGKVREAWTTKRKDVATSADKIAAAVKEQVESGAPPRMPDRSLLKEAVAELKSQYDSANGGFGHAPKFPPHNALPLLFYAADHDKNQDALGLALGTLDKMASGGIRDHLGGGFHRYSTDSIWLLPHFEKMLYDNALLARAYTEAYRITRKPIYREVAEQTLNWAIREMRGPEGLFYSSLDADSDGEEGKFYTWRKADVIQALGAKGGATFCRIYGIEDGGNYAEQSTGRKTGRNVLHLREPIAEVTRILNVTSDRLSAMRAALRSIRSKRVRPGLDDKRLAGWNGLMIGALARAAAVFQTPKYGTVARETAVAVKTRLMPGGILQRRWRQSQSGSAGTTGPAGYLEDYAYLIDGLLEMPDRDGCADLARSLADQMIQRFHDPNGGFFDSSVDHGQLFARGKNCYDRALPNANAVAARALLKLAQVTGKREYREQAMSTLRSFGGQAARAPSGAQAMVLASVLYLDSEPNQAGTKKTLTARPVPGLSTGASRAVKGSGLLQVKARALPVVAGDKGGLVLMLTVAKGWHINSNKPLDESLIPTRVEVETSGTVIVHDAIYPPATKIRLGFSKTPVSVYQGTVTIRVPLEVPKTTVPGAHPLTARIRFQACNDKSCQAPETISIVAPVMVKRR